MRLVRHFAACLCILWPLALVESSLAEPARVAGGHSITVLNTASFYGHDWDVATIWRYYETWRSDEVRREDGTVVPVDMSDPQKKATGPGAATQPWTVNPARRVYGSPTPPEGWAQPDFDDSAWFRHPGPFPNLYRTLSSLCVRGKFQVKDPTRVSGLTLGVKFQGGIIAYLNGREVGRSFIPAGKIDATTLADLYPASAYLNSKGGLLIQPPYDNHVLAASNARRINYTLYDQETLAHFQQRGRSAELQIPSSALRKGLNVLAVEVRRAPADVVMFAKVSLKPSTFPELAGCWNRAALEDITLTAGGDAGALSPNLARPPGVQVWNEEPGARITAARFGDPNEPLRPIRLTGVRNGAYAGRVVVGADKAIQGLSAKVTDLRRAGGGGGGAIPAAAMQIAYGHALSDALDPTAPAEVLPPAVLPISYGRTSPVAALGKTVADSVGAVVPVWVTVRVPRDAPAGEYAGSLTISRTGAAPVTVPVEMKVVGDWVLPAPQNFVTFIGIHESSDSVAMQYQVPLWSGEHWKHLDKVYELLGQIGVKDVYLPVIAKTHLANEQSLVRWIRQADGTYQHDFTNLERYLDTALKHLGKPPVVCLYLHDYGFRSDQDKRLPIVPCVTELDPKTGKLSDLPTPAWGTPEAQAFWKPVIDKTRALLAQRGVEKSLMFGMGANNWVKRECLQDLKALAPQTPWVNRTHFTYLWPPQVYDGSVRQPAGLSAVAMGAVGVIYDPGEEPIHPGWKTPELVINFARWDGARGAVFGENPATYRVFAEGSLLSGGMTEGKYQVQGSHGVGHLGADYWPVLPDPRGGLPKHMGDRYTFWHSLSIADMVRDILAPGVNGPVPTVRHQMMRESLQDAEVLVFVENALLDPAQKARLGAGLAQRCQDLCEERVRMLRHFSIFCGSQVQDDYARVFPLGRWMELSEKLYALAGAVDKALGTK